MIRTKPTVFRPRFFGVFLSFSFVFACANVRGQVIPPIRNFQPTHYGAENQNWDIAQGPNGWMYFANNSGLLEFNGEAWNIYPSPNGSVLRSVQVHEGRVYSGCYMDFGFWDRDEWGAMQYHSLSDRLGEALLEDEQFWNIQVVDDWVLFQSLQRIYAYHVPDSRFEIIPSEASRALLFAGGKRIYFVHRGNMMLLENGEVQALASVGVNSESIVGLVQLQGRPVFLTEEGNFLEVYQGRMVPFEFPGQDMLKDVKIYSCLQLQDGTLAFGTISRGLLVFNPDGQLKLHLKKENGLNNNTVLSLEEDGNGIGEAPSHH